MLDARGKGVCSIEPDKRLPPKRDLSFGFPPHGSIDGYDAMYEIPVSRPDQSEKGILPCEDCRHKFRESLRRGSPGEQHVAAGSREFNCDLDARRSEAYHQDLVSNDISGPAIFGGVNLLDR